MATLEDKILGEKLHNYCSSSEESDAEDSDSENTNKEPKQAESCPAPADINKWEGTSSNTGPKGVLKDWQQYKKLETEKRDEDEKERIALMKKLTLTVQTALDEEKEDEIEDLDLNELLQNDLFLLDYQKKRMEEMLQKNQHNLTFGQLIYLCNGQDFLDAIDKENKAVQVIVHLYEDKVDACRVMNSCLVELSKLYDKVKFCTIIASRAGLSRDFKINGVPALLIYKAGNLVGNFVRLSDDLGNEFAMEDVQNFLIEHGMLEDKSCTPLLIRKDDDSEDSD